MVVISGSNAFSVTMSSVDSLSTTIPVSSVSTYAPGDVIKIDNEEILIGSIVNFSFTNCMRGYNNTSPSAHTANSQVYYWAPGPNNTQIYVNSTAEFPFPVTYSYVIKIDNEEMKVVGGGSVAFTVIRGFNGTSPASHSNNSPVSMIQWEWLNKINGATIESNSIGEYLTSQSSFGDAHKLIGRIWGVSLPVNPFHITAKLAVLFPKSQYFGAGIFFRESQTGKIVSLHFQNNDFRAYAPGYVSMYVFRYNNENSWNVFPIGLDCNLWPVNSSYFRMSRDGQKVTFAVSVDGLHFTELYSENKNAFFANGPDQAGFYIDPYSQIGGCTLTDWRIEQ